MKRLYITAILLTGLGISSSAIAQSCSSPCCCWINGVSSDGMKTTEPAKEVGLQIQATAPSKQCPEKQKETAKMTAVPSNSTKMKVVATR